LKVVVVRYFNSYGPRIDESGYGSVIARFAGQALAGGPITVHGDGRQSRCFTYVSDTVRGTMLAAETESARSQVFNIGGNEEITVGELAKSIDSALGTNVAIDIVPYESFYGAGFEDTRRRVPDVRRARDVLGFEAEVRLADGLRTTLDWCRANYASAASPR
jgi:UDP-glucose 4-epimerase